MGILLLFIGLVIGAVTAWLIQAYRVGAQGSVIEERAKLLEEARFKTEESLNRERNTVLELSKELASSQVAQSAAQEQIRQNQALLEEAQKRLKVEFENLANRIFEEKSNSLASQSQSKLGSMLTPLQQQITEFRQRIDTIYTQDSADRVALKAQIESLTLLNQQVTQEANNLTLALKGQSKTQGNWGELILETILERSGLVKGEEYEIQVSMTTPDNRRLQPDVVIHLPENKHLIIDSKVSLTAYERYCSAETASEKTAALAAHLDSIRGHIDELSRKDYPSLYQIDSPDFVLMFLPIEPAFSLALQNNNDLYTIAFERKIILVTASTLLATLRTVAQLWKQEKQTRNAIEIARQSGALYDQFVRFLESLEEIGNTLGKTNRAYEEAMARLKTGRGNLVKRVEDIRKLGAKASKTLPANLLDEAELSSKDAREVPTLLQSEEQQPQ
jgi:DNA recombination protein RmuC